MTASGLQLVRPAGVRHEALAIGAGHDRGAGHAGPVRARERPRSDDTAKLLRMAGQRLQRAAGADQAIYNSLYTVQGRDPLPVRRHQHVQRAGREVPLAQHQGLRGRADAAPSSTTAAGSRTARCSGRCTNRWPKARCRAPPCTWARTARRPSQGSFLLVIGHVHAGFTNNNSIVIWWNAKNHVEMPQSGFRDSLILQGWREVVRTAARTRSSASSGTTSTQ